MAPAANPARCERTSRRRASACTRARGRARRISWLKFRAARHESLPRDRIWLLDKLRRLMLSGSSKASGYLLSRIECRAIGDGRFREIFPLRPLSVSSGLMVGKAAGGSCCANFLTWYWGCCSFLAAAISPVAFQRPTRLHSGQSACMS